MEQHDWYQHVRAITESLTHIRSVSPGMGENELAQEILHHLLRDGLESVYAESGYDAIPDDLYQRRNVYALLRGASNATVILLGHFDTVDTQDYGSLAGHALHPETLARHVEELLPVDETIENANDWLFGRGTADMKSGVAVNIALLRHFARASAHEMLPISLLFVATPDEENESAGMLQAVHLLTHLRTQYGLDYLGLLNTDYVTARYPGDTHNYIYAGAMGKLLPAYLCIGVEAHVGEPFQGLDANLISAELIRDVDMNIDLCDHASGQVTAPPVTLHATDLKTHYDVQLPLSAYFYLNVLTLTTTPNELLQRLRTRAQTVLQELLHRIDRTEQQWRQYSPRVLSASDQVRTRSGTVYTYSELYVQVVNILGQQQVEQALLEEWSQLPSAMDTRQRSAALVARLWQLSARKGPAVVLFYAPPYYPIVSPIGGMLQQAITATIMAHPEANLVQLPYFPYLSDISYTSLDVGVDIDWLHANMPVWQPEQGPHLPGTYRVPLEEIRRLNLPAFNWGPFGFGAHSRSERVQMSYAFQTLPQLLYETIMQVSERFVSG